MRQSAWVWMLASACAGVGLFALAAEYRQKLAASARLVPTPDRRLEQFEQLARQANGQGVGALPSPQAARGDSVLQSFLELAKRGMPSGQLKSCLDGEIEARLARQARSRRWSAIGAAVVLGFGLCGLAVAMIFALRQAVEPGTSVHLMWPAFAGAAVGILGIPVSHWLRDRSRTSSSSELLDLTLVATGLEAIAEGQDPSHVRSSLGRLLPKDSAPTTRRRAA